MAFDGRDRLYAADAAPPRIVRLNPRTGSQRDYARFRDVPPCAAAGRSRNCSETSLDMSALPDYPVFAPGGAMYVTDLNQALIWRVPPVAGRPEVWYTEHGFESLFGPNGIQFLADGRTLLFALSTEGNPAATPAAALRPLPAAACAATARRANRASSGGPGSADVPDGFAIARSGNVYVALAGTTGNAVAVISPSGEEIARVPASEIENQQMEIPFDQPASAAFLGGHVLVTNHALFSRNAAHYAVLDLFAGEPGLPLFRPFGGP